MVADLKIDGKTRRVVMQASKNGYFYVLDAKSGQFISANNFVTANWTNGFDPKTGRAERQPGRALRRDRQGRDGAAGRAGRARLASDVLQPADGARLFLGGGYVVRREERGELQGACRWARTPASRPDAAAEPRDASAARRSALAARGVGPGEAEAGVAHRTCSARSAPGTLATAGGSVFQGTTKGQFVAYRATDGKQLWSMDAQTGRRGRGVLLRARRRAVHRAARGLWAGSLRREQSVAAARVQAGRNGFTAAGAASAAAAGAEPAAVHGVEGRHRCGRGEVQERLHDVP